MDLIKGTVLFAALAASPEWWETASVTPSAIMTIVIWIWATVLECAGLPQKLIISLNHFFTRIVGQNGKETARAIVSVLTRTATTTTATVKIITAQVVVTRWFLFLRRFHIHCVFVGEFQQLYDVYKRLSLNAAELPLFGSVA